MHENSLACRMGDHKTSLQIGGFLKATFKSSCS